MRIQPDRHQFEIKDSALNPFIAKLSKHPLYRLKPEQIFSDFKNQDVIVDLGCGNGHFLRSYLSKRPGLKGVGIDRRFKRLFKTANKIQAYGGAVCFWDVPDFCAASPTEFFNLVSMQFPDPWPKKRHSKHRMLSSSLLRNIHRILKSQSSFCFVSDCKDYYEFLMAENAKLKLFPVSIAREGNLFEEEDSSLFMRTMNERQIPIYSLVLRKL